MTANVSCRLLEVDYSAIEGVLVGWYLRDPVYIRLAKCGIHAAVTARKVGIDVDLGAPDAELTKVLKQVKKQHQSAYELCKRVVHGNNYGLTPFGMVEQFPEHFPTVKIAEEVQAHYYTLAPKLPEWHQEIRQQAKKLGYLGGPTAPGAAPSKWDHPYGYRHWFWDVLSYQPTDEFTARKWLRSEKWKHRIVYLHGRPFKVQLGGDAKRVIAFYPQSTAAGRLKEAELDLFDPESPDYIGDCYFGRTPLLGPIHDSLLLHIPARCFERVVETVCRVMSRPTSHLPCPPEWNLGPHLAIGVAAKAGKDWASMMELDIPSTADGVRTYATSVDDAPLLPRDADDQESWDALRRVV